MEPRVINLLLTSHLPSTSEPTNLNHLLQFPSTAVFPSSTLPAIRPLHEDQSLESRDFRNQIDSLQLPEIDWQALESPLYGRLLSSGARVEDVQPPPPALAKKSGKSAVPLAEVLNSISPEVRNEGITVTEQVPEPRKRRRIDSPSTRILPKPSPSTKKGTKRQRTRPFLPPLLVPLHEPPPDAKIIPSINTDGFRERLGEIPTPTPESRQSERELALSKQSERSDEAKDDTVIVTKKAKKSSHPRRNKWTDEETEHLLKGVAKYGIGNWRKIVNDTDFEFNERTAVDLKDRFRTCCPDQYRKDGKPKEASDSTKSKAVKKDDTDNANMPPPEATQRAGVHRKKPEHLAKLGISAPFHRSERRARTGFSVEEDKALLRGYSKHGAQWTKIQSDPEFPFASRKRTDLRDRFRNRYPEKFMEAGHRFASKKTIEGIKLAPSSLTPHSSEPAPNQQSEDLQNSSRAEESNPNHFLNGAKEGNTGAQHSLRLLTASMGEPFFTDMEDLTPNADNEDPETIILSRNIFDWADQQSNYNSKSSQPKRPQRAEETSTTSHKAPPRLAETESTKTLSRLDHFNINPMLASKVPPRPGLQPVSASLLPNLNYFPPLPLSGILNGPVSLPPPRDLVAGGGLDGANDG